MSGSRWVITPLLLSGSWWSFVYSCHLFLISSPSVRFILFLSFIVPIFAWNIPLISLNFLEEIAAAAAKSLQSCLTLCHPIDGSPPGLSVSGILQARILEWVAISISSLSHLVVFLYFFALITEEDFIISPCCSLELCIQMGINFPLLCLSLLFFSQLFATPPQTTILPFCASFSWAWSWSLLPVQCHELLSIVLQALCLSDLIPWIYFSLLVYNHKGFDLGDTWMV